MAEACFRVTGMLDVDDALQALVDEARSITDARYGVLVTFNDAGAFEDLVMAGISPEERRRLWALPEEGQQLFAHLRRLPGPLRTPNLRRYTAALGLPAGSILAESFLSVPARQLGKRIGNFFLGGKTGGEEFTPEDEEILGMFASHAAVVITNARAYRDEQRARAELEALINDSPLGVLVFDAKTGGLLTVNEETRRLVGGMRGRGHSLEALLTHMTFRHPDGHELGLDELPLTRALSAGATIRAEEVVIEHTDGNATTTLVNARPIYSDDDEIVSVVVTLQDMTPLEEIERQRAEFLGIVSRGLRTPLTTIKGSTATVLGSSAPPDPADMLQFFRIIDEQADRLRDLTADLLDVSRIETGKLSIAPGPAAVAALLEDAARAFESTGARQRLRMNVAPELPPVIAETPRIVQVLRTLLATASTLSASGSRITITASPSEAYVAISIAFEGVEISPEDLPHVFSKLYRLTDEDERAESTNLGLAICKGVIEAHGGRIWATSDGSQRGSQFTFTLPVHRHEDVPEAATDGVDGALTPAEDTSTDRDAIVIVDSDPRLVRYVRQELLGAGYAPYVAEDPYSLDRVTGSRRPNLVLLDIAALDHDGVALATPLAEITDVPTILLCDRDADPDIATALELGAVDYLAKPFSPTELIARVKIALNRPSPTAADEPDRIFRLRDLTINYAARAVSVAGRPVQLSATEYNLLVELSANAGRVLTQRHLLERVWGTGYADNSQILRTYIRYLRRKLHDDIHRPKYIFTSPTVGYHMPAPQSAELGPSQN